MNFSISSCIHIILSQHMLFYFSLISHTFHELWSKNLIYCWSLIWVLFKNVQKYFSDLWRNYYFFIVLNRFPFWFQQFLIVLSIEIFIVFIVKLFERQREKTHKVKQDSTNIDIRCWTDTHIFLYFRSHKTWCSSLNGLSLNILFITKPIISNNCIKIRIEDNILPFQVSMNNTTLVDFL